MTGVVAGQVCLHLQTWSGQVTRYFVPRQCLCSVRIHESRTCWMLSIQLLLLALPVV